MKKENSFVLRKYIAGIKGSLIPAKKQLNKKESSSINKIVYATVLKDRETILNLCFDKDSLRCKI